MIYVDWSKDIPPEYRAVFEPLLNKHLHRCPSWMHELWIYYKDDGNTLVTSSEYEYRQGRIGIGPNYLNTNDRLRELAVVHELLHFHCKPIQDVADELRCVVYKDNADANSLAKEHVRVGIESVVTDLTRMVLDALEEGRNWQIHTRSHHADDARRSAEA